MHVERSNVGGEMEQPASGDSSMVTRFALWAAHLRGAKKRAAQAAIVAVLLLVATGVAVALIAFVSHLAQSS